MTRVEAGQDDLQRGELRSIAHIEICADTGTKQAPPEPLVVCESRNQQIGTVGGVAQYFEQWP